MRCAASNGLSRSASSGHHSITSAASRSSRATNAAELAADEAVREADTVLFTVPNQLGVAYNARILATIARHIAPAIGCTPAVVAGHLT
jgi:predicted dinucleotide-binding enzyme